MFAGVGVVEGWVVKPVTARAHEGGPWGEGGVRYCDELRHGVWWFEK